MKVKSTPNAASYADMLGDVCRSGSALSLQFCTMRNIKALLKNQLVKVKSGAGAADNLGDWHLKRLVMPEHYVWQTVEHLELDTYAIFAVGADCLAYACMPHIKRLTFAKLNGKFSNNWQTFVTLMKAFPKLEVLTLKLACAGCQLLEF